MGWGGDGAGPGEAAPEPRCPSGRRLEEGDEAVLLAAVQHLQQERHLGLHVGAFELELVDEEVCDHACNGTGRGTWHLPRLSGASETASQTASL